MAAAHWVRLNEKRAALKALPEHLKDRVQKVSDVTAFQIARLAESKAPRGKTKKLSKAFVWKSRPSMLSAVVQIDTVAFYWKFQEYGTVNQPARPFVRPAGEAMKADHEQRFNQAVAQSHAQMEREGQ